MKGLGDARETVTSEYRPSACSLERARTGRRYNVMGQMVSVLHEGNMSAGMHSLTWDAADLASGMYIIKAEAAGTVSSQKVMLLK